MLIAGYFLRTGEETIALSTLRRALDSASADVSTKVWPVFTAALVSGRHQPYFDAMARENAAWWPEFFRHACARAVPSNAVQTIFSVRVAAGVATADERRCLIERLQSDGQWANAYVLWLNSLPPEQRKRVGYVFNGDFEAPFSNTGFDWRIPAQESTIVVAEPGDGVMGSGDCTSRSRASATPARRSIRPWCWSQASISSRGRARRAWTHGWGCSGGCIAWTKRGARCDSSLARTPFTGVTRWREFRSEFAVPSNCPAQLLRLELANPKQGAAGPADVAIRLKGKLWFDDIGVRIVDESGSRR
jgi:hypothetical protein